jgi:hypothetical protein
VCWFAFTVVSDARGLSGSALPDAEERRYKKPMYSLHIAFYEEKVGLDSACMVCVRPWVFGEKESRNNGRKKLEKNYIW